MAVQAERDTQVALVAGATRGAGRAIAVELARAGWSVYATGRSSRVSGRGRAALEARLARRAADAANGFALSLWSTSLHHLR